MLKLMRDHVAIALPLPTADEYRTRLENSGYVVDSFEDCTKEWSEFTSDRAKVYALCRQENEERLLSFLKMIYHKLA